MPLGEAVTTIAAIAALALGFISIIRLIGTTVMHRTIRRVVDKDPASAEPLLSRLTTQPAQRAGDDRLAVILVAIGVAMIVAPIIAVDDAGLIRAIIAAALFPLIIGFALGLRLFLMRRAARREAGE
jgi:hypothetical protein